MKRIVCALLALGAAVAHAQTPPPPEVVKAPEVRIDIEGAYTPGEPRIIRPRLGVNPSSLAAVMHYFYPAESVRNREEGEVTVTMCITETGKVVAPVVTRSSGFPRLDNASQFFMQGIPIKPATLDGQDVPYCGYQFSVVWMMPPGYSALPAPQRGGDLEDKRARKGAALSPGGAEP